MAITDRNLSVGTQLFAKYKGQTHTAEVVEKEGAKLYRLEDGREFKSPSADATAITGKACNRLGLLVGGRAADRAGATARADQGREDSAHQEGAGAQARGADRAARDP